MCHNLI